MWNLYWNEEYTSMDDSQKVLDIIIQLNCKYIIDTKPMIVQVENSDGDRMCIGIGNSEGYSFIDFFPFDGSNSKHVEGENIGDGTISFCMGDYESEFYINETISYLTAINVLKKFLLYNKLDELVKWIND